MKIDQSLFASPSAPSDPTRPGALRGATVLVVEDEAIVALDLVLTLRDEGALVEGPLHRLEHALAYENLLTLDVAVLDIDLAGREVFAFADRLAEQDVPIVFHTGRSDLACLTRRYPKAAIISKPCMRCVLVAALSSAIGRRGSARQAATARPDGA